MIAVISYTKKRYYFGCMDQSGATQKIVCSDGYELDGVLYSPRENPVGFILFQSGAGIKKGFYTHFCRFLAEQGFYVLSYDYRGIGGSRPASLKGFEARLLDWGRLDMAAAIQFAVDRYPELPLLLIGHSMGTQLIGFAGNNHHLKVVIGIGSSTGTWWKMKRYKNWGAIILWYMLAPLLVRLFGYAPLRRLGIMEDLPGPVIREWSRWCRNDFYFGDEMGKSIDSEAFYPLRVPFVAHYFKDDPIATDQTVTDLLALYRGTKTRMIKHRAKDYHVKKIGHFGPFSRKFSHNFWKIVLHEAERFSGLAEHRSR